MKNLFSWLDNWNHKLTNAEYWRNIAFLFVVCMIPVWFILGFDSGVGMIEEVIKAILVGSDPARAAYSVYGMTFHFSSYVIYGLLFIGLSLHLETINIRGSRNIMYSAVFSLFNIGIFEMVYMTLFAVFQMNRSAIGWFIEDFFNAPVATHFSLIVIGVLALLYLWADSYIIRNEEVVWRYYHFQIDKRMVVVLALCVVSICFWVFYPFPVQPLVIADWKSSHLFPQTHYAYMRSSVHMVNNLLHLVNIIVKAMFAVTQLYILRGFKNVNKS